MADSTLRELPSQHKWLTDDEFEDSPGPTLVIAWCVSAPDRVGEAVRIPDEGGILGRGDDPATLMFRAERPAGGGAARPLESRLISRSQLAIARRGEGIAVRNTGSRAMSINGKTCTEGGLETGDVLTIENQLVLILVQRGVWPAAKPAHRFGRADAVGMVGESQQLWNLRSHLDFLAGEPGSVLLRGPSGVGKELAARALHTDGPFVARNAATLPHGLIDAELFGSARGYPHAGMPERRGLVGEADGGTLFLDEIGEMPEETQAHLLRVLDADGEYQRLGEARSRRSRFRCVAATNRPEGHLKHDLYARFLHRVSLPGLAERPDDIPLLAAHLLAKTSAGSSVRERFCEGDTWRMAPALVEALLRHPWATHVRELETVLWAALQSSPGRALVLTQDVQAAMHQPDQAPEDVEGPPAEALTVEAVHAALHRAEGSVTRAARDLGLSSRYVLYRHMRRLGVDHTQYG